MQLQPNQNVLPPSLHKGRWLALFFVIATPFAFGALAVVLGQDANWDLRNYHWYNAYAFLNQRYGIDLLPSQTPYFYNPALDVPFYWLATHVRAVVAGYVLGTVQGLNFDLLFMLAFLTLNVPNPRQKVIVCAVVSLLGMLGGGGIAMLGTTFYDNITSLGLFLSLVLVVRHSGSLIQAEPKKVLGLALIFGVPAGIMMGLKLPSVIFCIGLCFALLLTEGSLRRRLIMTFGFGLGVLLGVALSLGPWAWFLQSHFGSPLFPYFNELFKSPLAPLNSARDTQYVVRSFHDAIFFPFIFTESPYRVGEIPWRDWRVVILYVLIPMALLARLIFGRSRGETQAFSQTFATRYLIAVAVITYAVWLGMFCIYRYLIPLEMLAPLLIVVVMGMLPFRISTRAILTAVVLLIMACSIQGGNWGRKSAWSDHFIDAKIPPLGDTSHLMILMAGFEPYSHIVTQFPSEIPIIRIQSNFASPDENKGINSLLHQRVDSFAGRKMILIPPWQHDVASAALKYYHLVARWPTCQKVVDRLYDNAELDLCALEPMRIP
jgi:hypothetical protein